MAVVVGREQQKEEGGRGDPYRIFPSLSLRKGEAGCAVVCKYPGPGGGGVRGCVVQSVVLYCRPDMVLGALFTSYARFMVILFLTVFGVRVEGV